MDFIQRHNKIQEILHEMFPIPQENQGSGIYLEIIQDGLAKWNALDFEDECCPQEFQVLWAIKNIVDVWEERDRADSA